jgi:hypothetical protein
MSESGKILCAGFALSVALAGCTQLGPEILRSGRPAYNDAILATNDEQLLQNIVRLRFLDSLGFLTVSSVTAHISLKASGAVNAGLGSPASYEGNLIPLAGALAAEENPTISYTPVPGARFVRQLMNQTPIDLVVLLMNTVSQHGAVWSALIRRVNDIRNPDFLEPPEIEPDRDFGEIAELIGRLQRRGSLYWVQLAGAKTGYAMVLHNYAPTSTREAARLLGLLGISGPAREGDDVVVPMRLSAGSPPPGAIALETRSVFHLMQLAAASIELPAELMASARQYPEPGPAGAGIRIRSSATPPDGARVAVEYRGRWYYIETSDQRSKQWFLLLQVLASAQVSDTAKGVRPVLTIPVGAR